MTSYNSPFNPVDLLFDKEESQFQPLITTDTLLYDVEESRFEAPLITTSTLTLICGEEEITFKWDVLRQIFRRFKHWKYTDTSHIAPVSVECVEKLGNAMASPGTLTINDEDVKLLNWLQLRDFRDGCKLYKTK